MTRVFRTATIALLFIGVFAVLTAGAAESGERILYQWDFSKPQDARAWHAGSMDKPKTGATGTTYTFTGNDPLMISPQIAMSPKPGYLIEVKVRSNGTGPGELFFTGTNEGQYGGFLPKRVETWPLNHDGQWHEYRLFPKWTKDANIIKFRLDFGRPLKEQFGKATVEIAYIRVVDLGLATAGEVVPTWNEQTLESDWTITRDAEKAVYRSRVFTFDTDKAGTWFYLKTSPVDVAQARDRLLVVRFLGSNTNGVNEVRVPLDPGRTSYDFDFASKEFWTGAVNQFEIELPVPTMKLSTVTVSTEPTGPAVLLVTYAGSTWAINPSDKPYKFTLNLRNAGGKEVAAPVLSFKSATGTPLPLERPESIEVNGVKYAVNQALPALKPFETTEYVITAASSAPGKYTGTVAVSDAKGPAKVTEEIAFEILPAKNMPNMSYVPEPKPVASKYELGALYFPGWSQRSAWDRILVDRPQRKPVLGWYDEANPEVVDWQINWAAQTGIQFFFVDWYWNKGSQHLGHWVEAFKKAKYRKYLKWAMMWANHNGPGSHSEEDQRAVTQYWIDNYFNMPEYYTIDGKPVVMIWSPEGMDRDVIAIEAKKGNTLNRGEGVKKLLEISRKMAVDAGYKGIYFIALKLPEAVATTEQVQLLKDGGFDCTSLYHFMSDGGKAVNPSRFPFDLVVDANIPYLTKRCEAGVLPFLPNISTGWDSHPWHGDRQTIIYGRTVEKFRTLCEDTKKFADEKGLKRLLVAPLNEWGEGSYCEPNTEYGFGMYEVLRETFAEKPAGGFPPYLAPIDVGLGPYDLPPLPKPVFNPRSDFESGQSSWKALMGITEPVVENGRLTFATKNADPAIQCGFPVTNAKDWRRLKVRMSVTLPSGTKKVTDRLQLFWVPFGGQAGERTSMSLPLEADGQFHDYDFDLTSSPMWRGRVVGFRFDPCNIAGVKVEIAGIALEK